MRLSGDCCSDSGVSTGRLLPTTREFDLCFCVLIKPAKLDVASGYITQIVSEVVFCVHGQSSERMQVCFLGGFVRILRKVQNLFVLLERCPLFSSRVLHLQDLVWNSVVNNV